MPDKLTDTEIKKAFKICNNLEDGYCSDCPYEDCDRCIRAVANDTLDLINRLQAENAVLEARIGVYETCNARKDEAIRKLQAENEKLKKTVDIHKGIAEDWKHEAKKLQMVIDEVDDYIHPLPFETDYDKAIKQAKAEAYKECIEKANEIIDLIVDLMFDGNVSKCQLPSCHKPSSIPCESKICIQENKEYWHSKLDNLLKELVGVDK